MAEEKKEKKGLAQPATPTQEGKLSTVIGAGKKVAGAVSSASEKVKEHVAIGDGYYIFIFGIILFVFKILLVSVAGVSAGSLFVPSFFIGIVFWLAAARIIFDFRGFTFSALLIAGYILSAQIGGFFWLILAAIVFILIGIKKKGKDFGEWATTELAYGVFQLFIFAADTGLILYILGGGDAAGYGFPFIPSFVNSLKEFIIDLIIVIPWWAALGAYYTDREKHPGLAGVASILTWILTILYISAMVATAFTPVGQEVSGLGLPTVADIGERIDEVREKDGGRANDLASKIVCTIQHMGEVNEIKKCERERGCSHIKDEQEKEVCLTGEKVAVNQVGKIRGEVMKVEILEGVEFHKRKFSQTESISLKVKIANPREREFRGAIGCEFEVGREKIQGEVSPNQFDFSEKEEAKSFSCKPIEQIPITIDTASVTMRVFFTAYNLKTDAVYLRRIFIGQDKSQEDTMRGAFFDGSKRIESDAPNDLVNLGFKLGQPTEDPIIKTEDPQITASINNEGGGEILRIRGEIRGLEGLSAGSGCKFQISDGILFNPSFSIGKQGKAQVITYVEECGLKLSDELRDVDKPLAVQYESVVDYDYRIEKKFPITVRKTS